jgi:hypothetical protein
VESCREDVTVEAQKTVYHKARIYAKETKATDCINDSCQWEGMEATVAYVCLPHILRD